MNEEEKKAIEMLDKFITEHKFYNIKQSDNLEDNIKIILNFIEKLQKENEEKTILLFAGAEKVKQLEKENEELKEKNLIQEAMIKDSMSKGTIKKFFIEKKKMKDKIEEILNNKEYRIVFEGDEEIPDNATNINVQKYIKLEKMQELL